MAEMNDAKEGSIHSLNPNITHGVNGGVAALSLSLKETVTTNSLFLFLQAFSLQGSIKHHMETLTIKLSL